jgi:G3E family GTPase
MRVRETVQLNDAGCACCRAKGPFVDTLRDLFMALLQRREPRAERLIILVPGVDDAVALRRMLQLDTFLADRYRLDGCVALLEDGLDPQQQVAGLSTESGCIVSGRGFGVPTGRTAHLVLH